MKTRPSEQKIYIADFETTSDPEDCRVWAACAVEMQTQKVAFIGNSIDSFMNWLSEQNSIVFFHNLAFDGQFVLSYLLTNGFRSTSRRENRTFDALISDAGAFYSINVRFKKSGKYWYRCQIRDSLKKINSRVEQIAKAYKLPIRKGKIDYEAYRAPGHELTEEEREYVQDDCKIVAAALLTHWDAGLDRITAASDAFNIYKHEFIGDRMFRHYFPVLPVEIDDDLRKAYRGGFTYLNPRFKEIRDLPGIVLDVNSEYPYILHSKPMPVGYPVYFEGKPIDDPRFPLYICRCRFAFELKPDHVPSIQIKNTFRFRQNEYLSSSNGEIVELFLTNIDLQLIFNQYDVFDFEIINGWRFQAKTGLFDKYIDKYMTLKQTSEGAKRQVAKLMLNSLYGKFGMNPRKYRKLPVLNDEGIVKYVMSDPEMTDPIYTALAAFVTSYGRDLIIRASQANFDRFIYSDTDSIHLIGNKLPEGLRIDDKALGAFKIEEEFSDSLYLRQKTYMHTTETGITVKCAGMPDTCKAQVTYDNFKIGSTFPGKLLPKVVKGGCVLINSFFTIH